MSKRRKLRNPGPIWGYHFLSWAKQTWPDPLFRVSLKTGTWIALCCMGRQRRASRDYLQLVLGRAVGFSDCFRHFMALTDSLVYKLSVGKHPEVINFKLSERGHGEAFMALARGPRPVLFGTFHVGHSDLLGCMLSEFERKIWMVRERVGNSYDLKVLERIFGRHVEFVWINEGESMLFALKSAAEDGVSLALQCDREEHGSRHRYFQFLGARRRFPVTIYHLSYLFEMPVVFSFAIPQADGSTEVICSQVFEPVGESKRSVMEAGYVHFQQVLGLLEAALKEAPYAWFNFRPLNAEASDAA